MTWIDRARAAVRKAVEDMPDDATPAQLKKRFRERGSLFHGGTYWGRRKWGQAVREYMGKTKGQAWAEVDLADVMKHRPDIIFPWRGESGSNG